MIMIALSRTNSFLVALLGSVGSFLALQAILRQRVGRRQSIIKADNHRTRKRRLGLLERWYVAQSRSSFHTGFCLGLCLDHQVPPTQSELVAALQTVSQRFAWLRSTVRRDTVEGADARTSLGERSLNDESVWGDDLYIHTAPTADAAPSPRVRWIVTEDVNAQLQEASIEPWHDEDPSQPLWRVTLVVQSPTSFTIVLSFHHLIIDGIGALQVAQVLLQELFHSVSTQELSPKTERTLLPPPLDEVVDTAPQVRHLLRPILLDRFPSLSTYLEPPFWKGKQASSAILAQDRVTQLICSELLKTNELLTLQQFAKTHQLRMSALLILSLCQSLDENNTFLIVVAADERRRRASAVTASELGAYVSGPTVMVRTNPSSSLQVVVRSCQAFSKQLQHALQSSLQQIGMTAFIRQDWIEYSRNMAQTPIRNSLGISIVDTTALERIVNDIHDSESYPELKGLYLAQGRRGFGEGIGVGLTISRHSGVRATLAAFPDVVAIDELKGCVAAWKRKLDHWCNLP